MNSNRAIYSYAVLRYVHDVVAGESLNVGIVVLVPTSGKLAARFAPSLDRIVRAFPTARHSALKHYLGAIQTKLELAALKPTNTTLADLLASVLPRDDSSFQWSESGSGVTTSVSTVLDELHERFVMRHALPYDELRDANVPNAVARMVPGWQDPIACNDLADWKNIDVVGSTQ